ncbi:MAG: hypothetical protein IKS20_02570 [Victivallales bacterium]|nr:hypothetical protein [Victivallales bacterium]
MKIKSLIACSLLVAGLYAQEAPKTQQTAVAPANKVQLQLPECIYAVPGKEINVYFDNIVLVINPDNYVFDVTCPKGRNDKKRWTYTPEKDEVGTYPWSVTVIDESGVLAEASMKIHVAPDNAGEGKDISILIVGDSLTNACVYPTRILANFQTTGNPKVKMVGSNGPGYKPQPDGVAHEGWAGWRWDSFINRTEPPKKPGKPKPYDIASRFINKVDGKPALDFQNYFNIYNGGKAPDFITFQLGVNDIFSATDENRPERIKSILDNADKLIAAARKDAPNAIIGVGLVTPGASSQDAFGRSYTCGQTRWQYKKNQHALNQAMLEKFKNYADKKVFIIPTSLNLDCENNFPSATENVNLDNMAEITRQTNGVHPAAAGYRQIGDTFYAWMKYFLK